MIALLLKLLTISWQTGYLAKDNSLKFSELRGDNKKKAYERARNMVFSDSIDVMKFLNNADILK